MKSLKKSIVMSAISLTLCAGMFAGTTFAWFTDSVSNKGNKIQAGTLDVSLLQKEANAEKYTDISDSETPVFDYALWEPGYSTAQTFKVRNNGTLSVKYQLEFSGFIVTQGAHDEELTDVIDVFVSGVKAGTLSEFVPQNGKTAKVLDSGILYGGTEGEDAEIKLAMQTSAGNAYQNLSATFDILLRATQATMEEDGFGNSDYDQDAAKDFMGITSSKVTVPVAPEGNTVLKNENSTAKIVVPKEAVAADATALTLNIAPAEKPADVVLAADEVHTAYEVSVKGIAADNSAPVGVTVDIGKGLTGVKIYHNSTPVESFDYDKNTGIVSFETTSFSPFTFVYDKNVEASDLETLMRAATVNGVYIKLLADIHSETVTGLKFETENVTATIDFNGHTVTSDNGNYTFISVAGSLTFTNGTITASDNDFGTLIMGTSGEVILDKMTLNNSRPCGNSLQALAGTKIVVRDCVVSSTLGGGAQAAGGTIDIHSGAFTQTGKYDWNSTNVAASNGGTANIYGGTFGSANFGLYVFSSGAIINVYGGTFDAATVLKADEGSPAKSIINVYGGTFKGAISIAQGAFLNIEAGSFENTGLTLEAFKVYVDANSTVKEEDGKFIVIKNS